MVVKLTQTTQKGGRGQHSPSMPGQLPIRLVGHWGLSKSISTSIRALFYNRNPSEGETVNGMNVIIQTERCLSQLCDQDQVK